MAVAELTAYRTFHVREQDPVPPAPGEVQVRVEAVGICGSDLHFFLDGHIGDTPAQYPQVLGHEPAGVITATGTGVSGWSVGDRVALEPPIYCYHCEWCMSGRHNLCKDVRFFSSPGEPGFFRDHANVPAENLLALPASLSFDEGSLFEPISIILHSFRFGQPRMGETAAVIGAGPIGLCTIACLKLAGAKRIYSVEPVPERREMAVRLGAAVSINPRETNPVHEILQATGGRGVDITFDCATQEDTVNQALYMTAPGGRAVITGVPQMHRVALDFHHMRRKELGFFSVRRANHTGDAAVRLLEEHPHAFTPMLTHTFPLTEVQHAFDMLGAYQDGVTKIVLRP
jgi:L-iditol 2-dehydrogenase